MSFVDKVEITVKAGVGGNGKLSFRHEKFISRGGPDGGDGGKGGNVVFEASRNSNTLAAYRYKKELKAANGMPGSEQKKHGKNAEDLILKVPVGTTIINSDDSKQLADLTKDEEKALIAKGGNGGFGNAHFTSSRRQTPNFAEKGESGESLSLVIELKMIADVGLVGLPNAGKSTLLSKISNARPEIAAYPFTTLTPNLGVVDIDSSNSLLFADIPGLIEGAAIGKGLGHEFLRHIERTAAIVHLVDAYDEDIVSSYETIRKELSSYSLNLTKKPEILAINKTEGLTSDIKAELINKLKLVAGKNTQILTISALAQVDLDKLIFTALELVKKERKKQASKKPKAPTLPVIELKNVEDKWKVVKKGKLYIVSGVKIERFAERTDFDNVQAVSRLKSIMRKNGIYHELKRRGIKDGQIVQFSAHEDQQITF